MNPTMKNVFAAFEAASSRPKSISIDRTGVELLSGGHFQGIQRMRVPAMPGKTRQQNLLLITSSSDEVGYFVPCSMADDWSNGRANAPIKMPSLGGNPGLDHAGGCQVFGDLLVAGIENHATNTDSEIQFWNFEGNPQPIPAMTIIRNGGVNVSTAGAVGISSYRVGSVLAVATVDARTVDFYRSEPHPPHGSSLTYQFTWTDANADKSGWLDEDFGSYQNINLVTQQDGQLFMVGFNRSGYSDWMDLYSVDMETPNHNAALRKMANKHMYCTDGCAFDAGAGIFIASEDELDVYAVNGSSGDYETGTTIHVNYFSGI